MTPTNMMTELSEWNMTVDKIGLVSTSLGENNFAEFAVLSTMSASYLVVPSN